MSKFNIPKNKSTKEILNFFKLKNLDEILKNLDNQKRPENQMRWYKTLAPDLNDLYRLYQFIFLNKRTTILEFGTGWSTLIMGIAINDVKNKYYTEFKKLNLRRHNPFEVFTLDTSKKYLNISKKRILKIKKNIISKVNYCQSDAKMDIFDGKYVSIYNKLPNCNPDFIYVDAPDLANIKGNIQNIKAQHTDMLPMINDILKFENFLIPGTIIIFDGRAANAIFCKNNFKRNWLYYFDEEYDQHLFYLDDVSLGLINQKLLDFYKN